MRVVLVAVGWHRAEGAGVWRNWNTNAVASRPAGTNGFVAVRWSHLGGRFRTEIDPSIARTNPLSVAAKPVG